MGVKKESRDSSGKNDDKCDSGISDTSRVWKNSNIWHFFNIEEGLIWKHSFWRFHARR